jgi:curved DNA-binding protein
MALRAVNSVRMKYKDYYATLGIARDAGEADIKKAYRKLAHKYHPDVSREEGAEARFKEIAEAYQTLKDSEKRAAYDQLGRHAPGEEIQPPPQWQARDGGGASDTGDAGFEGFDFSDLFARMRGHDAGGRGAGIAIPGEDHEAQVHITLEQAYHGTQVELQLVAPQRDAQGRLVSAPRTLRVRIPKGATEGQRVRLAGQGGKGFNGGRDGDLYVRIELQPHRLYRPDGHDLYIDLPLAPWEAALGATVAVPTLGGTVNLKIPAGTIAGQTLRLAGRGLPKPGEGVGDLRAIIKVVMPPSLDEKQRELLQQLAAASSEFDPRAALLEEARHAT